MSTYNPDRAVFQAANFFIMKANEEGTRLTKSQIMKLVFFTHCHSLGLFGRPLSRDGFEAWDIGPVHKELYYWLTKYGFH